MLLNKDKIYKASNINNYIIRFYNNYKRNVTRKLINLTISNV